MLVYQRVCSPHMWKDLWVFPHRPENRWRKIAMFGQWRHPEEHRYFWGLLRVEMPSAIFFAIHLHSGVIWWVHGYPSGATPSVCCDHGIGGRKFDTSVLKWHINRYPQARRLCHCSIGWLNTSFGSSWPVRWFSTPRPSSNSKYLMEYT